MAKKTFSTDYGKLLKELKERRITQKELCKSIGIMECNLTKCLKGETNFFPKYRKLISEYLEFKEQELFPQYFKKVGG